MSFHWLSNFWQAGSGGTHRLHPYFVYEMFGIPSWRWFNCLTEQVGANERERQAIAQYVTRPGRIA